MEALIQKFFNWEILVESAPHLFNGIIVTLELALICLVTSMILGLIVTVVRLAKIPVLTQILTFYIDAFRGTPLLVQIIIFFYALPDLGINLARWPCAIVCLTLNSGAFVAEVFRGGIESIPRGQYEAAQSLGLNYIQTMIKVVIPQAVKRSLPALTNCFVALLKDTSLVSTIGVVELLKQGRQLQTWLASPTPLIAVGILYFVLIWPFVKLAEFAERRLVQ